jgi:hypothetical protein
MLLCDAILKSARTGAWVEVPPHELTEDDAMKLGILTAPFPDRDLLDVAAWAAKEGFGCLEVACWPAAGGAARRYAGTCHLDVAASRARGPRR